MANRDAPPPAVDPRLAAVLRLAGELRDLPSEQFKARLKAELLGAAQGEVEPAAATPSHGRALQTEDDIRVRLEEIAQGPALVAHDLAAALGDLPERSMRFLAALNQCTIGVSRFSGQGHWERHPAGDELLHILSGEGDVITVTDDGPVQSPVRAGSLFICPQGLWHRVVPRASVSILFATPGDGTEVSNADVPPPIDRSETARRRTAVPALVGHDLGAALHNLPMLTITASTTEAEADAAVRQITSLGPCSLGVMRYAGLTPWERHPDGDELLHVLEGAVDVTILADAGPTNVTVRAGSVFVCPRGLWHRQVPQPSVTMLFGTPSDSTEVSFAADPRLDS